MCLSGILSICHVLRDQVWSAATAVEGSEFVVLRCMIFKSRVSLKEALDVQNPSVAPTFITVLFMIVLVPMPPTMVPPTTTQTWSFVLCQSRWKG